MANKKAKKKKSVLIITLIAVCVCLIVAGAIGTFAAFTNSQSAQRTIAVYGTQGQKFSSSYLKNVSSKDNVVTAYVTDVSQSPSKSFTVCNYESGKQNRPYPEAIRYGVTVRFVKYDGSTEEKYVTTGVDAAYVGGYSATVRKGATTVTLNSGHLTDSSFSGTLDSSADLTKGVSDTFVLVFDTDFAENQPNLYVEIIVTPDNGLAPLRGIFKTEVRAAGASNAWTGVFTDSSAHSPAQYDGFNYSISGVGAGTVTISWDDTKVGLSYVSLQMLLSVTGATQTGSIITFPVDSDDESKYELQFYKVNVTTETWVDMNSTVVTFSFS